MGEDGHEVGQTGELDKASNESLEGSLGSEVDAGEDGHDAAADEGGVEGVLELVVDAAEPVGEGGSTVTGESPEGTTCSNVTTSGGDQSRDEGDDQETQATSIGTSGLEVDLGKREVESVLLDKACVLNGVEDSNHVQDTSDETNAHLSKNSLGDVATGLGDLLGQVGRAVRGSDTVSTVEHTHHKDETLLLVASLVIPLLPYIVVGVVGGTVDVWHDSADNDRDENTSEDEEHASITDVRQDAVQEQNDAAAHPGADDEADEDLPGRQFEVGVHQRIHRDRLLGHDEAHRGSTQNPCQTVPPTSEEPTHTTILSGCDRRPVVNTTGRRHTGSQFGKRSSHHPVTD